MLVEKRPAKEVREREVEVGGGRYKCFRYFQIVKLNEINFVLRVITAN